MATETRDNIWAGLARELLHRPDVRSDIKAQLTRALERDDPDEIANEVQSILAKSVAGFRRETSAAASGASPAGDRASATHALALVNHGLALISETSESISPRLALFVREALLSYARAYDRAGQPKGMESAESVTR